MIKPLEVFGGVFFLRAELDTKQELLLFFEPSFEASTGAGTAWMHKVLPSNARGDALTWAELGLGCYVHPNPTEKSNFSLLVAGELEVLCGW